MATYTLSYTGAEANSAIGTALNLFTKTNTWTGTQSFATANITTATISSAGFNAISADDITTRDIDVSGEVTATQVTADRASISGTLNAGTLNASFITADSIDTGGGDISLGSGSLDLGGGDVVNATDVSASYLKTPCLRIKQGNAEKASVYFNGSFAIQANNTGVYLNLATGTWTKFVSGETIPADVLYIILV